MRTLHLLRHGETIENTQGILQGGLGGNLSEKGRAQTKLMGQILATEQFDMVFVSAAERAQQTWEILATFLPQNLPVVVLEELQERTFGVWEGQPKPTPADWEQLPGSFLTAKPKGGESITEFNKRVRTAIAKISTYDFKDALVISHNGFIRSMITQTIKAPQEPPIYRLSTPNLGYSKLFID